VIEDLVPEPKPGGRPAKYPRREILNGLLYVDPCDVPTARSSDRFLDNL